MKTFQMIIGDMKLLEYFRAFWYEILYLSCNQGMKFFPNEFEIA